MGMMVVVVVLAVVGGGIEVVWWAVVRWICGVWWLLQGFMVSGEGLL